MAGLSLILVSIAEAYYQSDGEPGHIRISLTSPGSRTSSCPTHDVHYRTLGLPGFGTGFY